jgi:hypothetical protein
LNLPGLVEGVREGGYLDSFPDEDGADIAAT